MAMRLAGAGHDLVVWNRTESKTKPLRDAGAAVAATPAAAARGADALITMLSDPAVVEEVLVGPDGAADRLESGATVIEMSTIGPDAARSIADRLPRGVDMVDAPVLGSIPEAESGSLLVFVGATRGAYERFLPVFSALGEPRLVGPAGAGAAMKLVVNSTLGAVHLAIGEALALAGTFDLDLGATLEVLEASPVSATVNRKRTRIESGDYPPNFRLALAAKDMDLIVTAARARGAELRGSEAASAANAAASASGLENLDYSAVVAFLANLPPCQKTTSSDS